MVMYELTTIPLALAPAISDKNIGLTAVKAPAPRPIHTLAKRRKP